MTDGIPGDADRHQRQGHRQKNCCCGLYSAMSVGVFVVRPFACLAGGNDYQGIGCQIGKGVYAIGYQSLGVAYKADGDFYKVQPG